MARSSTVNMQTAYINVEPRQAHWRVGQFTKGVLLTDSFVRIKGKKAKD